MRMVRKLIATVLSASLTLALVPAVTFANEDVTLDEEPEAVLADAEAELDAETIADLGFEDEPEAAPEAESESEPEETLEIVPESEPEPEPVIESVPEEDAEDELSSAAGTVTYNLEKIGAFAGRTKADVVAAYSKALTIAPSYSSYDSNTYYKIKASTKSPYNAGQLTSDTLLAMQSMTDFYRWLVGAQPLKEKCVHSADLQAGALVRNFDFAHSVDDSKKPADMPSTLWQQGANADHNIVALGYNPRGAIYGWINEGYDANNNDWNSLIHRFVLIGSEVSGVQFGYAGSIAIGQLTATNNSSQRFTAFPPPGYVPNDTVYPYEAAWSLCLDNTKVKVDDPSKVKVTIKNLSSNKTYTRNESDDTLRASWDSLHFVQPLDATEEYTSNYSVTVTGLTDVKTGGAAKITYTVRFFDASYLVDTFVKSVSPEISSLHIYETLKDTASLKKIAAALPAQIIVTTETGSTVTVPVVGHWKLDEKNRCYTNSASAADLPNNVTDKNNLLKKVVIPYDVSDKASYSFNSFYIESPVTEGNTCSIVVYCTQSPWSAVSRVYKIVKNSDGTYSGKKWLDKETSKWFDKKRAEDPDYEAYQTYNVKNMQTSMSGEYVSIYCVNGYPGFEAYVGTSFQTLSVRSNDLANAKMATVGTKTYTGKAITPKPKVTLYGTELTLGIDYKLTYKNNTKIGVATVTATGIGKYKGSLSKNFRICFKDVPTSHWAFSSVHKAVDAGLIAGYSGSKTGMFGPEDNLTRGQVAVFLWRMAGKPKAASSAKSFKDVQTGAFCYNAVRWAAGIGVVNGYSGSKAGMFGPEDNVTREQLAIMIANYAAKVGGKKVSGSAANYKGATDAGSVSSYARGSVGWCYKVGIMPEQKGATSIRPKAKATRAETAAMIWALYKL